MRHVVIIIVLLFNFKLIIGQLNFKGNNLLEIDTSISINYKSAKPGPVIESIYEYEWNNTLNGWDNKYKTINEYDGKKNLVQTLRYIWDGNNEKWIYSHRYEYQYNELNKNTLYEQFEWGFDNHKWINYLKNIREYDEWGNCTLELLYHWDKNSNKWKGTSYNTKSYDERNLLTLYTEWKWNDDENNWYEFLHRINEYDNSGNIIKESDYIWNNQEKQWFESYQKITAYDSLSRPVEYSEREREYYQEEWVNKSREVYFYNANNVRHKKINYTGCIPYDTYLEIKDTAGLDTTAIIRIYTDNHSEYCSGKNWYISGKDSSVFDSSGNLIECFQFKWILNEHKWDFEYKGEYKYNKSGNNIEFTSYIWDTLVNEWRFTWKFQYVYDANGNKTESKSYSWDDREKKWIDDIQNIYVYNSANQCIVFEKYWYSWIYNDYYNIKRTEYKYTEQGDLKEQVEYTKQNISGYWQESRKIVYYWSYEPVAIKQKSNNTRSVSIYPNPFNNSIYIKSGNNENIKSITIYNIQGQVILSKQGNNKDLVELDCSKYYPGAYLIKIETNTNLYTEKIIKND